jgi:hypothetical protein
LGPATARTLPAEKEKLLEVLSRRRHDLPCIFKKLFWLLCGERTTGEGVRWEAVEKLLWSHSHRAGRTAAGPGPQETQEGARFQVLPSQS